MTLNAPLGRASTHYACPASYPLSAAISVRFIHTADWHLGRLFHARHLTEDQAHVLEQLIGVIRDVRPDALIVAGDIYDRAVPPPDAVRLLGHFLREVALGLRVPVIMIAGNHDSPDRLGFGAELLRLQNVHIFGLPTDPCGRVTLDDGHGPVHVYCLPYAEPPLVRACLGEADLTSHEHAVRASVGRIRAAHHPGQRSILVGHAFVVGGEESRDSERPLSIGGADQVDAGCFEGFDYVALGHLHRPQRLADGRIRYSGSLLKYSFSEADHRKGVHLVEMNGAGRCHVEDIPLTPQRDVRRVRGRFEDLVSNPGAYGSAQDYLLVELEDEGLILDAMGRLRERFPNVMHIERLNLGTSGPTNGARPNHRGARTEDLFSRFFLDMTGVEITRPQKEAFTTVLEQMEREGREAAV